MNEIILAAGAIVIVTALFIFIKKRSAHKKNLEVLELETLDPAVEDIYSPPPTIESKEKSSTEKTQQESVQKEEQKQESLKEKELLQEEKPRVNLKKRTVPPHDKITKSDLKIFSNLRILVAEDNLINQKVIAGLLAESGAELVFANDGLEAINYINNQKNFDIVLMDANMPNMDGLEATRRIKAHEEFRNIPIIALSGDIAQDDIKRMLNAGMDDHLEKPLKIDALYDILYAYTGEKENTQEEQESTKTTTTQISNEDLNIQKGLEISMEESFYKEILKDFLYNYLNGHHKVKEYIQNKQLKKADKLLLDLIGISANIGADNLHQSAIALKQALPENPVPVNELKNFHQSYENLLKKVKEYLAS